MVLPLLPERRLLFTAANIISVLRMLLAPTLIVAFHFLHISPTMMFALVIGLFLLDGLDGFIARRTGTVTMFGSFLDILADRVVEATFWIYLASVVHVAPWFVLGLLWLRIVLVDAARVAAFLHGDVLASGIVLSGWRRGAVLSKLSRGGYAMAKAVAFSLLLVPNLSPTVARGIIAIVLGFSLYRGIPILVEYSPLFLRRAPSLHDGLSPLGAPGSGRSVLLAALAVDIVIGVVGLILFI